MTFGINGDVGHELSCIGRVQTQKCQDESSNRITKHGFFHCTTVTEHIRISRFIYPRRLIKPRVFSPNLHHGIPNQDTHPPNNPHHPPPSLPRASRRQILGQYWPSP